MNEDEVRKLFSDMRDAPVPADSLRRVRLAVAQGTQTRLRWFGWWQVAAALALGCLCVVALRWRTPAVEPPIAPKLVVHREPVPIPVVQPTAPVRRRVVKRAQPPRTPQVVDVIRIETPDPDVVILLISD